MILGLILVIAGIVLLIECILYPKHGWVVITLALVLVISGATICVYAFDNSIPPPPIVHTI